MSRLQTVKTVDLEERADTTAPRSAAQEPAQAQESQIQQVATQMLMMAIKALSQRFITAVANLFTLVTSASAFYLWAVSIETISTPKIIALTIYSIFILTLNIWGRRT